MKIYKDTKRINRSARIGQITTFGGLIVLGLGMFLTYRYPDQVTAAWACLLAGFLLSQVGIYFGNRFGRRPRPDEILDTALKGMDDRWSIYHYFGKLSDHLLVGPGGIWLLKPYHQTGKLIRNPKNKRWEIKGGGVVQAYLRIFAQENIGRPDLEIQNEVDEVKRFFASQNAELQIPDIRTLMVMTSPKIEIEENDESTDQIYPVVADKLKEIVRKKSKENGLQPAVLTQISAALETLQ